MLVLDTNHLREIEVLSLPGMRLITKLRAAKQDQTITVVTVEENLRGWLAEIRRHSQPRLQITAYERLIKSVESNARWTLLPWDEDSARVYDDLLEKRVRIGTQDLKIAAITLAHDATLLTRNKADFAQVPGLRFENWLDE